MASVDRAVEIFSGGPYHAIGKLANLHGIEPNHDLALLWMEARVVSVVVFNNGRAHVGLGAPFSFTAAA